MRNEQTRTIRGTFGGQHTECLILVRGNCYAIKGATVYHVAADPTDLIDGVWLKEVRDVEYFTMKDKIETEQDLIDAINA